LIPVLFFTVAQNKLASYVLPVTPALAIVLAVALHKAVGNTGRLAWWLSGCGLLMVFLPMISTALPEAVNFGIRKTHLTFGLGGLPFVLAAGAIWWMAFRGHASAAILATGLTVALGVGYLKISTFPVLDQRVSARGFWRGHREEVSNACLDYSVNRAAEYGLNYYAGHALPRCENGYGGFWIEQHDGALRVARH
jgi:hypothetical protein